MSGDESGAGPGPGTVTGTEDARRWIVPSWLRLATAARILRDEGTSHLLVVDQGRGHAPVRTLAERDVLRRLLEDPHHLETVDRLTRSACVVDVGTPDAAVARILAAPDGPEVVVVRDDRGEVVGLVTPRTALRAVAPVPGRRPDDVDARDAVRA